MKEFSCHRRAEEQAIGEQHPHKPKIIVRFYPRILVIADNEDADDDDSWPGFLVVFIDTTALFKELRLDLF